MKLSQQLGSIQKLGRFKLPEKSLGACERVNVSTGERASDKFVVDGLASSSNIVFTLNYTVKITQAWRITQQR